MIKNNLADALLVIDLQKGVCDFEWDGKDYQIYNFDKVIDGVNERLDLYYSQGLPIIFIQHNDESLVEDQTDWKIVDQLNSKKGNYFVQKKHANSFYKTNLQEILQTINAKSLEICGAQTQYCVDSTIKFAHGLGYNLQMVKGLSTTYDNDYMSAENTINFYEDIWNGRFLKLL
ncbi:amidase [Floricoccus penangensis]|uniref:Amidase n=1 Tax=Floricoccus penangensis TaxID=1859475 RepID=A0A9Q5JEJ4_9LACT|nr:cysteine hydrolase family protein [Floricoccus penangensis]OFI45773.1 amidase [Floricoccus penangensis]